MTGYSKADFIGRDAALRERAEGPKSRRVSFVIEVEDADVMGDEPIWARVGEVTDGLIDAPHGHGAPRFDAAGEPVSADDPQRDGEWRVVGWITSGGYGHHVQASIAQGYLPASLASHVEADRDTEHTPCGASIIKHWERFCLTSEKMQVNDCQNDRSGFRRADE